MFDGMADELADWNKACPEVRSAKEEDSRSRESDNTLALGAREHLPKSHTAYCRP
jgi:hypothetical protein